MATVTCAVIDGFNLSNGVVTEERHEVGEVIVLSQADYDYLVERKAVIAQ